MFSANWTLISHNNQPDRFLTPAGFYDTGRIKVNSMSNPAEKAKKIINRYKMIWMKLEHVTSVGTGKKDDGSVCLVITLSEDSQATKEIFPAEIEDLPVEFRIGSQPDAL